MNDDQERLRHERAALQARNGKIHAEIWRLGKQAGTEDQVFLLGNELDENTDRIRTLNRLIRRCCSDVESV